MASIVVKAEDIFSNGNVYTNDEGESVPGDISRISPREASVLLAWNAIFGAVFTLFFFSTIVMIVRR